MNLPVAIGTKEQTVETRALLDCGASSEFMDSKFAELHNIPLIKLRKPRITRNADGTLNEQGVVTHKAIVNLGINGKEEPTSFFIAGLGKDNVILGLTWFRKNNPIVNWKEGTLKDRPHLSEVLRRKVLASRKKVEVLNDKLAKGTPFETKPLRTIEINNVEVPEKAPTLAIEDKPETMARKATVEEVPDEEAPTLAVNQQPISDAIIEEIPPLVNDSEDSDKEPLNAATLESEDEMIIAYIKGEPVIGIFEKKDTLFTGDHDYPKYGYDKNSSGIRRISTSIRSKRYTFGQDAWIRAKTSISQQLAHDKADFNSEKKKSLDDLLLKAYHEYKSVFEKEASERFPESRPWDHAIDLKPDFIPKDCKVYPLTPVEQTKLDEFLEENLRKGYIRPSKSPMASPFFFVSKKDSDALRPCQDYRYLNDGMVKNVYPLPLVSDLLDKLKGANIFTKLDIRWGYHNIRIKEGDEWKGAFKTNKGLFEPTVMFFGLCNSPATFQAMMNNIFRDMLNEGWLIIYMDDILIYSSDPEEHRKRTLRILARLRENDLFLKAEKCKFDVKEVEYLGLIISKNKIAMDPTKLAGIRDWPAPTNIKGVRSFLGFGNFYRRFIGHFVEIARPLNALTKKDQPFEWTTECQEAFDALK
jgi:hypothetical protein